MEPYSITIQPDIKRGRQVGWKATVIGTDQSRAKAEALTEFLLDLLQQLPGSR